MLFRSQTTYNQEQEKLHQDKEEQACFQETMRKMDDLFEEVCMDIETEDQCIQNIGHTFMTPHGISDEHFSEEIIKNLTRLPATQFPVSRNILVHENHKLDMESKMIGNHSQLRRKKNYNNSRNLLFTINLQGIIFHMLGSKLMNK